MNKFFIIILISLLSIPTLFAQEKPLLRNSISITMSDIIFQRFTFDFERAVKDGKMSVIVPLSVRFGSPKSELDYNSNSDLPFPFIGDMLDETDWYIGLGFLFYSGSQQKKIKFFFGPEIRYGDATHVNVTSHYDDQYENRIEERIELHYSSPSFLMNAGFKIYPVEQMFVSLKLAIGAYTNYYNNVSMLVSPGIKIGLSF